LRQKVAPLLPLDAPEVCDAASQQQDLLAGVLRMSHHPPLQLLVRGQVKGLQDAQGKIWGHLEQDI